MTLMNNTSLFRIALFQIPVELRKPRFSKLVFVFISYLQMLILRLEMFIERSNLEARMTPQVCYLERILKISVSPFIEIKRDDLVLYMQDEPGGSDLYIDGTTGVIIYSDPGENYSEFVVFIPNQSQHQLSYALELLNKYSLPSVKPIITLTTPKKPVVVSAYTKFTGNRVYTVFDEPMQELSLINGRGFFLDEPLTWTFESLSEDLRTATWLLDTPIEFGAVVHIWSDFQNYQPLQSIYGGMMSEFPFFPVYNQVAKPLIITPSPLHPEILVPGYNVEGLFSINQLASWQLSIAGTVVAMGSGEEDPIFVELLDCQFEINAVWLDNTSLDISFRFSREGDDPGEFDGVDAVLTATTDNFEATEIIQIAF